MSIYSVKLPKSTLDSVKDTTGSGVIKVAGWVEKGLLGTDKIEKSQKFVNNTFKITARVCLIIGILLAIVVASCIGYGIYQMATNNSPFSPIGFGVTLGVSALLGWEVIAYIIRLGAIFNEESNHPAIGGNEFDVSNTAAKYSPLMSCLHLCADTIDSLD